MDQLGGSNRPFFFLISFDKTKNLVIPEDEWQDFPVHFKFPLSSHGQMTTAAEIDIKNVHLPKLSSYKQAFEKVRYHLRRGDTYLLNLSFEVPISLNGELRDVFHLANAPYKVFLADQFVSFSPEPFLNIHNDHAYTFPMKGTIDASIPNAKEVILNDYKEKAEHYTIVDLLRNDLSSIGKNTKVNRFRYLSPINRKEGELLQVSSEIQCELPESWPAQIGTLLMRILPAGSISGAPKKRTVEIINAVENHDRQWYTGVAGVYRDRKLNSSVLIRYIGQHHGQYYYKTGGGITFLSDLNKEYEEIRSKIYIPIA